MIKLLRAPALLAGVALMLGATAATAEPKYGPGTSDKEIKVGQTIAYSGPASAFGAMGKTQATYFKWLNETQGGINGRKVTYISRDDAYQPPKAIENVRSLVEGDEVALIFGVLGTPLNTAIRPYLNGKKVPHLFNAAGSPTFNNPKKFPWTTGWQPNLHDEAKFYGQHIVRNMPGAKIGVLYQNDDFGKDMLAGLKEGLGDKADQIVSAQMFQPTDPTVDSQLVILKNAGVDTLMLFTYPKQGAQAIAKVAELNWKPATFLHLGSASVGATLKPAGLENARGIMTAGFIKDPVDPQWDNDEGMKTFKAWMAQNMPGSDISDSLFISGYATAQTLEHVLRMAGDDLTRENIMKQVANIKNFRSEVLLPGSYVNTSPDNYAVVTYMKLQKFDGQSWRLMD